MAYASTYAGTYAPRLGSMIDGSPPVVWNMPIAASAGIVAGEFVDRTNGLIVTTAVDDTKVLGLALEASDLAAAGDILVLVATAQTLFMAPIHHGTEGSADIEEADMGVATYDLHFNTLPYWYVDKEGTAGVVVTIHKFVDPVGTVNGLVLFSINVASREVT